MATLISNATGNLTGASTFAAAETGTGALNLIRFNVTTSMGPAATVTSVSFTVTNGKVIDGVLLYVRQAASGSTGTFKVDLQKGGVSQASVTVNKTDLPQNPSGSGGTPNHAVFFKFTSTATGDGGSNWTLVLTTTGTQAVYYAITASGTTNVTRALRTTTAATPAAGDDLYITGELTGAGTHNSYTVTMNSTAATVYGNGAVNSTTVNGGIVSVGCWGTLSYGTSTGTNYILRIAGDLRVFENGTLNIGSTGAEIPRDSTAVLEFQQVSADGDFGLWAHDYSTVNMAGLSRTSGKNVVKCKLTADAASSTVIIATGNQGLTTSNTARDLEATGTSLLGLSIQENTANSTHSYNFQGSVIVNTTQTISIWLAQGTGPSNNRYVRLALGNTGVVSGFTNGFYTDLDLQAGTASAITNVGTGVGSSVSITASGSGWLVRMTGKVATASSNPNIIVASCSAPGTVTYTGASNWTVIIDHVSLVTTGSISDTTFSVDTDTGWLSGDVVCVASTSRTYSECELFSLNANAGASSFASALYPCPLPVTYGTLTHSGTAPTQAEVGLLTRNVKVRSTSTTLMSFLWFSGLATCTISWVEFYRLGPGTTGKHGIEFDPVSSPLTANPKVFNYCSAHDFDFNGFYVSSNGAASLNLSITYNVLWNTQTGISINIALTGTDWTFDNNLVMRIGSHGFPLSDCGGTLTNNTVVGNASGYAFYLVEGNGVALGTFSGNTCHSGLAGLLVNFYYIGTISNMTVWRMNSNHSCCQLAGGGTQFSFQNLTSFGNTGSNVQLAEDTELTINGATLASDANASYPTTYGIYVTASPWSPRLNLSNVDMSGVGTGLAAHTINDIFNASTTQNVIGRALNCKFGAATVVGGKSGWTPKSSISFQKYNQVAGDHRCETTYGTLKTDSVIYHDSAPSMRMTPSNASNKLESAIPERGIVVGVPNGATTNVAVYIRKSVVGDGAAYNGNQPRLIQRANPALGQNSDVVLDTAAVAAGSWEQLTGTSSTATDDGAFEFVVDCDGTAGWVNIDDWST